MSSIAVHKRSSEGESQRACGCSNVPTEASRRAYHTSSAPIIQTATSYPYDGGCPRYAPVVQTKLKISEPNDKYEQEVEKAMKSVKEQGGIRRKILY